MQKITRLLFMLLSFFLYTNISAEESTDFDFDAMDSAMVETGLDQTIQVRVPSRLEMALRRIADPILFFCFRSYSYLKDRYTRMVTAIKTVFNRRFNRPIDENNELKQA